MAKGGSAKRASKGGKRAGFKKYNAAGERIVLHGSEVWIPSAAQAVRLRQLIEMEKTGMIEDLKAEVRIPFIVNNHKITVYRVDHLYYEVDPQGRRSRRIYEDVKGLITPEFKLKHKLFNALMHPEKLSLIEVPDWNERSKYQKEQGLKASHFSIEEWFATNWKDRLPD